ncbi:MAG: metal ABC transporter permease [Planctomycetes bacterium]|nr:metal ABC transporter permease [Planctomycetota bacterium]
MIPLDQIDVLLWPFLACLVLVGIHGYLGIHVLSRKVIFVDLAMAQIAALGATFAFILGHEIRSTTSYFLSLGFTLAGAAVFAVTRTRHERVPQEAVIGLVYAMASAAGILVADLSPHGGEHIKTVLAGSIVWVTWQQVAKTAAIYAVVGAFHWVFRDRFLAISIDPEAARERGIHVRFWDFLFYLSFGLVITSSVSIAGVLLVFCYLIAPAVGAALFASTIRSRLAIAWTTGTVVSAVGLLFSYTRPSGPAIICTFAAALTLAALVRALRDAESPRRFMAIAAASAVVLAAVLWSMVTYMRRDDEHEHAAAEHAMPTDPAGLMSALHDEHPNVRAEAAKSLGEQGRREAVPLLIEALRDSHPNVLESAADALRALGASEAAPELLRVASAPPPEDDWWVPYSAARALAEVGGREGIDRLFFLARDAEAGKVRRDALAQLKRLLPGAGAPAREREGLKELEAWWKENRDKVTFDSTTRVWKR